MYNILNSALRLPFIPSVGEIPRSGRGGLVKDLPPFNSPQGGKIQFNKIIYISIILIFCHLKNILKKYANILVLCIA
jgi:hypothetical protein